MGKNKFVSCGEFEVIRPFEFPIDERKILIRGGKILNKLSSSFVAELLALEFALEIFVESFIG